MAAASDDSKKGRRAATSMQMDDGAGLGELLKAARERRGLTLEQVARETKIPRRHLEALERDNLAALPGPFYQRAEIRTYARAIGLDPDLALARLERGQASPIAANGSSKPQTTHKATRVSHLTPLAPIALGLALTAVVLWRVMPRHFALEGETGAGRAVDSTQPIGSHEAVATPVSIAIERTEVAQGSQAPAETDTVRPVVVEPVEARPTVGVNSDVAMAMKQGHERPTPAQATELVVATEPAGARVTVDGIGWGVTPVTIRHLPPGNKRIRVSKEGYSTIERVVSVAEGHRSTTDIRLPDEP
jgi:cytoskeletal protein RodZ